MNGGGEIPRSVVTAREACLNLAAAIERHGAALREILRSIESEETIEDELFKTLDALCNLEREGVTDYAVVGRGAAFMPLNLPLYSLVIFGIIPGLFAHEVYMRPPELMRNVVSRLLDVLADDPLVRRLQACNMERRSFLETLVADSAFVSFTGQLKNANVVLAKIRKSQLFLFNGQGANPLVVAADAPLDAAVKKACAVKRFNSGQDCAAPDIVLVHGSVFEQFVQGLCAEVGALRVGSYAEGATIGPLLDPRQVLFAAEHLLAWRDGIVAGGSVSLKDGIVWPTVITSALEPGPVNRSELFAPIWHVCRYDDDQRLPHYFDHPQYRQHAMYVSLFGTSEYLERQTHSRVLHGRTVIEVERGYLEFGGHAPGASFVRFGGNTGARPILISREIRRAFPAPPRRAVA